MTTPTDQTCADHLAAAEAAFARDDLRAAVAALLAAWRAVRDVRLAALFELASAEAVAGEPPLPGATVAAQLAAFAALPADDPLAVGRILALPWPALPALVRARLAGLQARAPDPRLALGIAAYLAGGRGHARFQVFEALRLIEATGDPRALPAVRRFAESPTRFRVLARAAIGRLEQVVPPVLDAAAAARVDRLAARYARHLAAAADASAREAALLAAIVAEPASRELKAVYADVLVARGDPRGELIALQLARGRDDAPAPRERELLAKHAAAWAPAIAQWFHAPVFRDGWFAGGAMHGAWMTAGHRDALLASVASDPAWRFVRVLDGPHGREVLLDLLAQPALAHVDAITLPVGMREAGAAIVAGPVPRRGIVELSAHRDHDPDWLHLERPLARCAGLPDLAALRIALPGAPRHALAFARRAPVLDRVRRVELLGDARGDEARALVDALAEHASIRTLAYASHGCRVELARAGDGFDVVVRTDGLAQWTDALDGALASLPTGWPRQLAIVAPRRRLARADRDRLTARLAAFPHGRAADVPWAPATAADAPAPHAGPTPAWGLAGPPVPAARFPAIYAHLAALGQRYDTFAVGGSAARRAIGSADTVAKWYGTARDSLAVFRDGGAAHAAFATREPATAALTGVLELADLDVDALLAWLAGALALLPDAPYVAWLAGRPDGRRTAGFGRAEAVEFPHAWLTVWSKVDLPRADLDALRPLVYRLVETPTALAVAYTPAPGQDVAGLVARFVAALEDRHAAAFVRELDFFARADAIITPVAVARGAARIQPHARSAHWYCGHGISLGLWLRRPLLAPELVIQLATRSGTRSTTVAIASAAALADVLAETAALLRAAT